MRKLTPAQIRALRRLRDKSPDADFVRRVTADVLRDQHLVTGGTRYITRWDGPKSVTEYRITAAGLAALAELDKEKADG